MPSGFQTPGQLRARQGPDAPPTSAGAAPASASPPRGSSQCLAAPASCVSGAQVHRSTATRSREKPRGPRARTAGRRRSASEWIPPCPRGLQTWTLCRSGRRCRCCCCCYCQVRAGNGRIRNPGGRWAGGSPVRGYNPGLGFPHRIGHQPLRSLGAHLPWVSAWFHASDSARASPSLPR